jgi:hypothetical protein
MGLACRDIRLTSEVYIDEHLLPLSAAMAALPNLTGTDDSSIN